MCDFEKFNKEYEEDLQRYLNLKLDEEGISFYDNILLRRIFESGKEMVETEKHDLFSEMIYHAKKMASHMVDASVSTQDYDNDYKSIVTISAPLFTINGLAADEIKKSFEFLVENADTVKIIQIVDDIFINFILEDTREILE